MYFLLLIPMLQDYKNLLDKNLIFGQSGNRLRVFAVI